MRIILRDTLEGFCYRRDEP